MLYSELRSLIIGRVYSSSDLAYYNRGNQFPSLIITNIDSTIGTVVFPVMTKVANEKERLRQVSRRALRTTSYLIFPLMIGLFVIAEPLVKLLLTEKWIFCVPFLQCSCIFYMCQPIQTTNWQIIKAVGRSDLCLKLEIIKKIIGVAIIIISMNYGVLYIAIGNALFAVISMVINVIPNRSLIGYSAWQQIKDLFPALSLSCIMGISVYFITLLDLPVLIELILQVITGGVVYLMLSWLFKLDGFIYLFNMTESFIKSRREKI